MLSEGDLKPADVLLSTGSAKVSLAIRVGTMSRFSHATLYIGDGEIVEAIGSGVTRSTLRQAMADDTLVTAYRRMRMSEAQGLQVVRYAKQQVGKAYDYAGAAGGGVTSPSGFLLSVFVSPIITVAGVAADVINRSDPEAKFYCSELVALSFDRAGVSLGSGAASSTPEDLGRSHNLTLIGTLKDTDA